jgi:hypothetical protein
MRFFFSSNLIIWIFLAFSLVGCTSKKALHLMPTPVLYQNSQIDPFAHLTPEHKSPQTRNIKARKPMFIMQRIEPQRPQALDQVMVIKLIQLFI